MPIGVTHKEEFADLINRLTTGLTNEQVSVRTGVSSEYIRKMRKFGQVPSEDVLERIAIGLADRGAKIDDLRVASGYEQPANPIEGIENVITKYRLSGKLSPEKQEKLMQYVREIVEDADSIPEDEFVN
ncbi:MAG: helix-turn-helix transcriptional regulator [Armatimonadota bacterium]